MTRRVTLALVAALVGVLSGWASADGPVAAAGSPVTVTGALGTADITYMAFDGQEPDAGFAHCGYQYDGSTLTLVLRSHGRQWSGVLQSGAHGGNLDDPTDPRFVPCGSTNFPGQYFFGTTDATSPTQGRMTAGCDGRFALGRLDLDCSFSLNGAPWLNAMLHLVNYNGQCDGELLLYSNCDDSYVVENVRPDLS